MSQSFEVVAFVEGKEEVNKDENVEDDEKEERDEGECGGESPGGGGTDRIDGVTDEDGRDVIVCVDIGDCTCVEYGIIFLDNGAFEN